MLWDWNYLPKFKGTRNGMLTFFKIVLSYPAHLFQRVFYGPKHLWNSSVNMVWSYIAVFLLISSMSSNLFNLRWIFSFGKKKKAHTELNLVSVEGACMCGNLCAVKNISLVGARGVMVIIVGNGHGKTSSKSWTRLLAFHIVLIPLGKVWIQLFSLQLWVNSRADWFLQP